MTVLEELRIEAGLSVSELARLAGISPITLEKAEQGKAIRGNIAGKICRVLSEKLARYITYKEAQITLL
jgi:predicted transcriptional regulator